MNIDIVRSHCLAMPGVSESFPFDDKTLVFKVLTRMFCLVALDAIPLRINVKCDPERAIELREQYESVLPGYHMNKRLWNTVVLDGSVSRKDVLSWMTDSYDLIVAGMKRKEKEELAILSGE